MTGATIHFLSLGLPDAWSTIPYLTRLLERSGLGDRVVDDPADADRVVVCDLHSQPALTVRRRLVDLHGSSVLDRTVCYDERDRPYPEFPGLYVGMPARYVDGRSIRAWAYPPRTLNTHVRRVDSAPDRLMSFVGSPTHPVRNALFTLGGDDVHVERIDGFVFHRRNGSDDEALRASYAEAVMSSAFVVCPRGHGLSSIRLFETMRAGRVPVIVSDEWAPPDGPDWESMSVRVAERDVASVVEICRARSDEAADMGRRAADAYEEWFSEEAYPARFLDLVERLDPHHPSNAAMVRTVRRAQQAKATVTGLRRRRRR